MKGRRVPFPVAKPAAAALLARRYTGDPGGLDSPSRCGASLDRHAEGGSGAPAAVPPIVGEVLASPGQPLDGAARAALEPRFGHDFAHVRVHAGGRASESAAAVQAHAYTVGDHVVFGAGRYVPHTAEGQRLIAHELAHVVQQRDRHPPAVAPHAISRPGDAVEHAAGALAERALARGPATVTGPPAPAGLLMRQAKPPAAGANPCHPTKWPVTNAPYWWPGVSEHNLIQAEFIKTHAQAVPEYFIPESALSGEDGKADLADMATLAIYEIKRWNAQDQGRKESDRYVAMAKKHCQPPSKKWHKGTDYPKAPKLVGSLGKHIVVAMLAEPGVIVYDSIEKKNNESDQDAFQRLVAAKQVEEKLKTAITDPLAGLKDLKLGAGITAVAKNWRTWSFIDVDSAWAQLGFDVAGELKRRGTTAPAGSDHAILAPISAVRALHQKSGEAKMQGAIGSMAIDPGKVPFLVMRPGQMWALMIEGGVMVAAATLTAAGTGGSVVGSAGAGTAESAVSLLAANDNARALEVAAVAAGVALIIGIFSYPKTASASPAPGKTLDKTPVDIDAIRAVPVSDFKSYPAKGEVVTWGGKTYLVIGRATAK